VYFLQRRKFYDDRGVAVEASQMQPYQPVLDMEPRRAVNA